MTLQLNGFTNQKPAKFKFYSIYKLNKEQKNAQYLKLTSKRTGGSKWKELSQRVEI